MGLSLDNVSLVEESGEEIVMVELYYPRNEGNEKAVEVGLVDVRAADSIRVRYDFDRDGWVILQDSTKGEDWQEVAFVEAWGRES